MKIYCDSKTFWYLQQNIENFMLRVNPQEGDAKGLIGEVEVYITND